MFLRIAPLVAAAALSVTAALAAETRENAIMSHPSQGEKTTIAGVVSRLSAQGDGIFVNTDTTAPTPFNDFL